jgi:flagellar biosynthetic protein FliR
MPMRDFLGALVDQVDATRALVTFALIMGRVMAIVILVPFLGGKNAPPEVKMGVGVTLTMILWPTVLAAMDGDVPITPIGFILMMLKEVFVGFAIGFVAAEIFYTVEMAGQLIDMLRGANQIQTMVPEITDRSSAFGNLQFQLLLALFLTMGLHAVVIESLFESFVAIPINEWPRMHTGIFGFTEAMIQISAELILVAVTLTMPVGIVCLIVETAFGLLNRVAPQINAYFMAFPAKVTAGVAVFFFAASMIIDQMVKHSTYMLGQIQRIIDIMS